MYRVITCNTNGIRAAARKGFFDWLARQKADVVCIQEIKAKEEQLTDESTRAPLSSPLAEERGATNTRTGTWRRVG